MFLLHPVRLSLTLIRRIQVFACFVESALSIVLSLQGLSILIDCARALSGDVEDFAQPDVAPDFSPARLLIAVEGVTILVGG